MNGEPIMTDPQPVIDAQVPLIDGLIYTKMLARLHEIIAPDWYLEVGTFRGKSLHLASSNFVAVDPSFMFNDPISNRDAKEMHLFQRTSDEFFASGFCERNGITFDLAFLDGLHHYDCLLRDFMNAEKLMSRSGTIVLHDCCPSTVEMTAREQCKGFWTGDVWKTLMILQQYRPDLDIKVAACRPTGLAIVRNLDPKSELLDERYEDIIAEYDARSFDDYPGGLAGYYQQFHLYRPFEVLGALSEKVSTDM